MAKRVKVAWLFQVDLFRYDLRDCDAVFFVGCTLNSDLDIKRIIIAKNEIKDKCFFILSDKESSNSLKKIGRFGTPCPIGVDGFAELIKSQQALYVPPTIKIDRPLLCFNTFKKHGKRPKIQDTNIYDLFLRGILDKDILRYSYDYSPDYLYYIRRGNTDNVIGAINNGCRNILIHSDLGNGKTLFVEGLALELEKIGYTVYQYDHYDVSLNREIETICKKDPNRTVIIVEKYTDNKFVIDSLKNHRTNQILIVTERTVINDMGYDWLESNVGKEFHVVDLNVLQSEEIDKIVGLFDSYGLWSHLSASNNFDKRNYIQGVCKSSFRNLLIGLLRSPSIISRFEQVVNTIRDKKNFYEAIVLVFIAKMYDLSINLEILSEALGGTLIGNASFPRNKVVREIIDINSYQISVKSSILAEALLEKIIDASIIKDVLVKAFKNLDKKRYLPEYRTILRAFLSYSNITHILNKQSPIYKTVIVEFFEEVRQCDFCKGNPHYWLQYAIVKLEERDFDVAQAFFNNAYSLGAKKDNFDTYQIDNHYARYLLENVIYSGDEKTCMSIFNRAHKILMDKKHNKDTKYYPFRVASNYKPFYDRFYIKLGKKDKEVFTHSCKEMLDMIDGYYKIAPAYVKRKDVQSTKSLLEQILAQSGHS